MADLKEREEQDDNETKRMEGAKQQLLTEISSCSKKQKDLELSLEHMQKEVDQQTSLINHRDRCHLKQEIDQKRMTIQVLWTEAGDLCMCCC